MRSLGYEVLPIRDPSILGLHLTQLFSKFGVDLVIDVGARVGEYGKFLRRNGYKGRIASFEPVAANLRRLQATVAADPHWDVWSVALGDADGTAPLHVSTGATEFSSFLRLSDAGANFYRPAVPDHVENVEVRRLDSIWDEVARGAKAVFVKCDTQGWDLHVLRGAGRRLTQAVGVQVEVSLQPIYEGSPPLATSLAELERLGFGVTQFVPVTSRVDGLAVEMDCVAVRCSDVMLDSDLPG